MSEERWSEAAPNADDPRTEGGNDIDCNAIADSIGADSKSLRHSLCLWATVEIRRLQLRIADVFCTAVLVASAALGVLAAIITASVLLIIGLRALFARWTLGGIPEILAAVCGLGLAFAVAFVLRVWLLNRIVRTAARRLAELDATNGAAPTSSRAPVAAAEPA
jgi:hypothetical protein